MEQEMIQICEQIFQNIITDLTLHFRFMDLALNRYIFVPDTFDLECDGFYFHYSPIQILKMYQNDSKKLTRNYLHVVFHSIFQHAYFSKDHKMNIWNIACDIAVENVILSLGLEDEEKKKQINKIQSKINILTAQKIYHYLEDLSIDERKLLEQIFQVDVHDRWYALRDVTSSNDSIYGDDVKDNPSCSSSQHFENASHDTGQREEGKESDSAEMELVSNALKDWKEISEKMETELEMFLKDQIDVEPILQSLKALHKEKYNYSSFLRKFMKKGEKLKINDEEFDYIFYTYGLKLYQNLPLIEPLEYKEVYNIKNLVIAIDTSGSVQGEKVQAFLQKTYNIFNQSENFFSHFHVRIIQCDMKIQEDVLIQNKNQFDLYIKNLILKGFGGTDFRPVFDLIHEDKTDGLLYFTDGDGIYPKHKPNYPVAFLFLEGNKDIKVPPWAISYTLEGEEYAYSTSEETN